jgi:virginiamycin B lyase
MYDPQTNQWKEWKLPGNKPKPYAVYVDTTDKVWISDFGSNSMYKFDPLNETFSKFVIPSPEANVRQILGIEGEIWGAESGTDRLLMIKNDSLPVD